MLPIKGLEPVYIYEITISRFWGIKHTAHTLYTKYKDYFVIYTYKPCNISINIII